jgi:hypothetical protein
MQNQQLPASDLIGTIFQIQNDKCACHPVNSLPPIGNILINDSWTQTEHMAAKLNVINHSNHAIYLMQVRLTDDIRYLSETL